MTKTTAKTTAKTTPQNQPATQPADPHRCSMERLEEALELLDHELAGLELNQPMKIRAIGGYALMKHSVRAGDRAFTVDIDSVTRDYDMAVKQAIRTVAKQLDLDPDWVNNDNVMDDDPQLVEEMIKANWLPQDNALEHINIEIADIPTLTRAKIIAATDAELSGRAQDLPDLKELLAHQGITTMRDYLASYPDPWDEHHEVGAKLEHHFRLQHSKRKLIADGEAIMRSTDPGYEHDLEC